MRRLPSKAKGLVTTATVSAPSSSARAATIGTPPDPVPPPRPAVMKTMSAPSSASISFSVSSRAARRPTSGLAPAPRPFVSLAPSWIFTGACDAWSACTSVLATMNSTPSSLAAIMRLMALPPPPPTPITLILAPRSMSSEKSTRKSPFSGSIAMFAPFSAAGKSPCGGAARSDENTGGDTGHSQRDHYPFPLAVDNRLSAVRDQAGGPAPDSMGLGLDGTNCQRSPFFSSHQDAPQFLRPALALRPLRKPLAEAIGHQTRHGRKGRIGEDVPHFCKARWHTQPNRKSECLFRQRPQSSELRSATAQDHAPAQLLSRARPRQLGFNKLDQFDRPRLEYLTQHAIGRDARKALVGAGKLDRSRQGLLGGARAPGSLHLLRLGNGRAQPDGNIVGEVFAPAR